MGIDLDGALHLGGRDRALLDGVMRRAPMVWGLAKRSGPPALDLLPTGSGTRFVAAAVVVSAIEVLAGDGAAVRRCGNLVKVRAFRAAGSGRTP